MRARKDQTVRVVESRGDQDSVITGAMSCSKRKNSEMGHAKAADVGIQ